ncbi:class I SAM-dependent methyltransferase [Streptomyces sp. NPDC029216]|uniref:class I SAM-dependent methyltransferase n=1 Tax=Streptomyces sp. NPDC029216 TaxID=3154701 RepID=UPI0033E6D414
MPRPLPAPPDTPWDTAAGTPRPGTDDAGDGNGIAGLFDRAAATYDRVGVDLLPAAGRLLVRHARIAEGEQVLDAGCGTGACLLPAARAVGPRGAVTGVDVSPAMTERTRQRAAEHGLHWIRAHTADVEDPRHPAPAPPPEGYDAVTAGMLLSFLRRPDRALGRFRSVLRPGGRLALSWWGAEAPGWDRVVQATRPFGPGSREEIETDVPGQSPPLTPERVERLVYQAGFASAELYEERLETTFRDPDHWWTWTWSTAARAFWESLPPDRLPAARAAAYGALEALRAPDGSLPYVLTAHVAVCHRW